MATIFSETRDPDVEAINQAKAENYYDRVLWQGRARQAAQAQLQSETPQPTQGPIQRGASFLSRHTPLPGASSRGGILGNSRLLIMLWFVAMILVASDEWKQGFKPFPRPARLWYTSLTFAILMAVSQIGPMVAITNALAIGFDIQLAYENISGNAFTLFGINLTGGNSSDSSSSSTPAATQQTTGPGVTQPVTG
jgi:hypothetical protein